MSDLFQGFVQALMLIFTIDGDLYAISARSLQVTLTATLIATLVGIPFGAWLAVSNFRLRNGLIILTNALMGLPPVVVGLLVYLFLSKSGPFGVFNLLFTPSAMIIAQIIIILPIIASISHRTIRSLWNEYRDFFISLNATRWQIILTLVKDSRRSLITAALAGFGRGIGEVGAIMIVGGNIDHATRVLTTAISLETSRGNFHLAMALGIVLIIVSILINFLMHLSIKSKYEQIDDRL